MRVLPLVGEPIMTVDLVEELTGEGPAAGTGAPSPKSPSVSVAAFARNRR